MIYGEDKKSRQAQFTCDSSFASIEEEEREREEDQFNCCTELRAVLFCSVQD